MRNTDHFRALAAPSVASHLDMASDSWRKRLGSRTLMEAASDWLKRQDDTIRGLRRDLSAAKRATVEAKEDGKELLARTIASVEEMTQVKGRGTKAEKPVAVIVSPFQHAQLTSNGFFKQRKLKGIDLYIATGVYGPVVLTQDGFNGFTRMAPELNVRATAPESDR